MIVLSHLNLCLQSGIKFNAVGMSYESLSAAQSAALRLHEADPPSDDEAADQLPNGESPTYTNYSVAQMDAAYVS
jgi:hypothetical protein